MTSNQDFEENLLEGVMVTSSTSCPNPDHSAQFTIDAYEGGLSCTFGDQDQFFMLSSNEEQEDKPILQHLQEDKKVTTCFPLTHSDTMVSRGLKKTKNAKEVKKNVMKNKGNPSEKWEKILQLDSKLVQIHYSGLLDETKDTASKISQIILTEEYCRLKTFQNSLEKKLKQTQFTLTQFQKQKRSMLNQINMLKNDNQMLRSTVEQLYHIIKELELSVDHYFQKETKGNLSSSNIKTPEKVLVFQESEKEFMPYSCDFLEEDEQLMIKRSIQEQILQEKSLQLQYFAEFVYDLKRKMNNIVNNKEDTFQAKLYLPIVDKFKKQSTIRDWIIEIITNLHHLEKGNTFSPFIFGNENANCQDELVSNFMKVLEDHQKNFVQQINQSQNKLLSFWFFFHTSLTTFIGIMINKQAKNTHELSFEDQIQTKCQNFLERMQSLKDESSIKFDPKERRYWLKMSTFLKDISHLLTFRSEILI